MQRTASLAQQFLDFFPLPQEHGTFRIFICLIGKKKVFQYRNELRIPELYALSIRVSG